MRLAIVVLPFPARLHSSRLPPPPVSLHYGPLSGQQGMSGRAHWPQTVRLFGFANLQFPSVCPLLYCSRSCSARETPCNSLIITTPAWLVSRSSRKQTLNFPTFPTTL